MPDLKERIVDTALALAEAEEHRDDNRIAAAVAALVRLGRELREARERETVEITESHVDEEEP